MRIEADGVWQFFFPKSSTKMRCLERKDQNSISNSIFTKHDKNKDSKAVTAARSSLAQQDSRNLFALVNGGQHLLLYECWMVILCVFVFVCVFFTIGRISTTISKRAPIFFWLPSKSAKLA